MRRLAFCGAVILLLANASHADRRRLDFRDLGIYGTLYDFCTFTVFRFQGTDDPARLRRYREMVHDAHKVDNFTLVGLNTFDRVTLKEPLEVYVRQTDQVLNALDPMEVDAFFLSAENVTWNNGLAILSGLYDHVKSRPPGPMYQWYTMPDVPHAKQEANAWIIDPYRFRHTEFRRYLTEYLVGGKPVNAGLNASEDVAPWESSQDQTMVCAEFDVPMFFYGVDRELGAPNVWRGSDEPGLATWRGWAYRIRECQQSAGMASAPRPFASAGFSAGRPAKVAGDVDGDVAYAETFDTVRFMDDATIEGFLGLPWSGEEEALSVLPSASQSAVLTYHLLSFLPLSSVTVTTGPETPVEMSTDGLTFRAGLSLAPDRQGRNVWVPLTLPAGSTLREWSLKGRAVARPCR